MVDHRGCWVNHNGGWFCDLIFGFGGLGFQLILWWILVLAILWLFMMVGEVDLQ